MRSIHFSVAEFFLGKFDLYSMTLSSMTNSNVLWSKENFHFEFPTPGAQGFLNLTIGVH